MLVHQRVPPFRPNNVYMAVNIETGGNGKSLEEILPTSNPPWFGFTPHAESQIATHPEKDYLVSIQIFGGFQKIGKNGVYPLVSSQFANLKMAIDSEFSHWKGWIFPFVFCKRLPGRIALNSSRKHRKNDGFPWKWMVHPDSSWDFHDNHPTLGDCTLEALGFALWIHWIPRTEAPKYKGLPMATPIAGWWNNWTMMWNWMIYSGKYLVAHPT